tara:strand:- start:4525 stop:4728 length:204 start_codon:yes stop_codon:yes gene_type:complete
MKLFITLSLISFSFFASANSEFEVSTQGDSTELFISADRGKKARKAKRRNKKRKKKCSQFGRRVYAG